MDSIVDPALLRDVPGRTFMYPCAGRDWSEALHTFAGCMDELMFVDILYQFRRPEPIQVDGLFLVPGTTSLIGPAVDRMHRCNDALGNSYRDLKPAWFNEHYSHFASGRTIRITRRRGFGQYALHELPDASLGVFLHRGDSTSEGGSDAWFLANKKYRHRPLTNLFDVLKQKMAYPGLIASDGSNTNIQPLGDAAYRKVGSPDAFSSMGLHWQRVGHLSGKQHRLTVIWKVNPVVGA